MTVRYRLMADPGQGDRPHRIVYVGLDVAYGDQLAPVLFEGMPHKVARIRDALDGACSAETGHRFDLTYPATARALRAVLASGEMSEYEPLLVAGEEIFDRDEPRG